MLVYLLHSLTRLYHSSKRCPLIVRQWERFGGSSSLQQYTAKKQLRHRHAQNESRYTAISVQTNRCKETHYTQTYTHTHTHTERERERERERVSVCLVFPFKSCQLPSSNRCFEVCTIWISIYSLINPTKRRLHLFRYMVAFFFYNAFSSQ